MKRCPTCSRTYDDDAMSFCLTDGTPLVKEEPVSGSFETPPSAQGPPYQPPQGPAYASPPSAVGSGSPWAMVGNPPEAPDAAWGGGYPAPPPPIYSQKREQGLAIASLVCGVLSIVCCSIFTGIPAIVLGIMAMSKEKNDPARYGGRGMAIGGIATGAVSIVIMIFYFILVIAGAIPMR